MTHHERDRPASAHRPEDGASAVEYGLLAVGIAAVVVAVVLLLGGTVRDSVSESCDTIKTGGAATTSSCAATTTTP